VESNRLPKILRTRILIVLKWRIACTGFAIVVMLGCGGPGLVPVEGTVTLDGKPLANATIGMELSGGDKEHRFFGGETDSAGKYVIAPFEQSSTGAIPGEYSVMIRSVKAPPGSNEMTVLPPEKVPMSYRDGSLKLSVPEGGTTSANFEIKTR
jgi:hypothetical protein